MSEEERTQRRNRYITALKTALRELAAADFLQRVMKGALSRVVRRKLRLKQSAFLRTFSSDSTGHALGLIVSFQRRVRLWLSHNDLFLQFYEEHRNFLLVQRTHAAHVAAEAEVQQRETALELAEAEAAALLEGAGRIEAWAQLRQPREPRNFGLRPRPAAPLLARLTA